jgi:signal transduction histidine kinase
MSAALPRWWPRSLRSRIALAVLGVSLFGLAGFLGARAVLDSRAHDQLQRTLTTQAESVARAVRREGPAGAQRAARLLPDTRIVVTREGEVEYWNLLVSDFDVTASARVDDIEVTLQRDENPGVAAWVAPLLVTLVVGIVVLLTWLASVVLVRRLRRSAAGLAGQAERVAEGDLTVRADETDDEVGRIARSFNRMAERLQQADARERAFLADVAHELRTPVTAIDGFAQALTDGTARSDEDRAEAAELIRHEAARLADLVGDLRRLTWLDLDPPVEMKPHDLSAACRDVLQRFTARAEADNVALVAPHDAIRVATDSEKLDTILVNLVDNALRHTRQGGVVRVTCQAEEMGVRIDVSDTGPGIAPEHLPFVFDRLYRADPARRRGGGEGSGLGLAIVKRAVELLGGRVWATSTPGEGATFSVHLPGPVLQSSPAPIDATVSA